MHAKPFDYATIRVVPRVERQEFINVGVVAHAPSAAWLACRIHLDEARLSALHPQCDAAVVRCHLAAFEAVCEGGTRGGPVGTLPLGERFHWLVHPRSAVLQTGPVHAAISTHLPDALEKLFHDLVS